MRAAKINPFAGKRQIRLPIAKLIRWTIDRGVCAADGLSEAAFSSREESSGSG